MTNGPSLSLWDVTAEERDMGQPLDGDAVADLAVVGGGFTGLATALFAAERGMSVHVVEAGRIGQGGSGRAVGLVNAGVWHPPDAVRRSLGDVYGPRFIRLFGDAPERVFSLIERHQIRCEATRNGTIHAAHAPRAMAGLAARHDAWSRLGAPVRLLTRDEVAERTGSTAFHGGLLDDRAGTINPMGYARGLARAARAAGAVISVETPVRALSRDGAGWCVTTGRGAVRAGRVVLATNAYTGSLWPGLDRVFTPISYFQLATRPLGDIADRILPGGEGLWDTGRIMFSLRKEAGNRLVIGSMGAVIGSAERGLSRSWALRRLSRLFPDLGPVAFEEAWSGRIAMTPDHLPRLCRLDDGVFTAIGYNGRGITTGTVMGDVLARLAAGETPEDLPLPLTTPRPVRSAGVMAPLYSAAFAVNQAIRAL
ncbi:FAD-dependent oxidoreductase [Alphaproteobacteria bacterium GH1-50]|uniref:FAD-dependent oxidoreductase n=1 Tax=Kangsaoukella pontilimi TaxID=2691042 RepID=A0A7C9M9I6_9RHOB|nr:FAD-binding oxidoreductase [Kangsaoukella pontilimi]MXQ07293.1 FAD-dependent oxidoreductase [Kangsaoukella pontilimi]